MEIIYIVIFNSNPKSAIPSICYRTLENLQSHILFCQCPKKAKKAQKTKIKVKLKTTKTRLKSKEEKKGEGSQHLGHTIPPPWQMLYMLHLAL